jgi:hypothetical protein
MYLLTLDEDEDEGKEHNAERTYHHPRGESWTKKAKRMSHRYF